MLSYLITGGCGFIGSNFIRMLLNQRQDISVLNMDLLTYAGNSENLLDVEEEFGARYAFKQGDIGDTDFTEKVFKENAFDAVLNFAAESHVDRSIHAPGNFVQTNVVGTMNLLNLARKYEVKRFLQVSTDEVYGSLGEDGLFTEQTPLSPNSPYSASKASADLFVNSMYHTFDMDVVITRCSNNYGPYQFPEKLIPLMILQALKNEALPVYGDGKNVRDWIHVEDHCEAIRLVLEKGRRGQVYNIGASTEKSNLEVIQAILLHLNKPESLITFVQDRLGHDRRYAIDSNKIYQELGWKPKKSFEEQIKKTIDWYIANESWWQPLLERAIIA